MTNPDVQPAQHSLGGNTQGFMMSYDSKEVFFTVSDPSWSVPKATLVYFAGANEQSEIMADQIKEWTESGYRVVTMDMPGVGQSSRDAQVGSTDVLHMNSLDEHTEAAEKVIQHIETEYADTQLGPLHFVSSGTGSVDALNVVKELPAGSVASITSISPVTDIDIPATTLGLPLYTDTRINPQFTIDDDLLADSEKEIRAMVGDNLFELKEEFDMKAGQNWSATPWSKGYFNSLAAGVADIKYNENDYQNILGNNGVQLSFIYDPEIDDLFDADQTTYYADNNSYIQTTTFPNQGVDLLYNSTTQGRVYAAIDSNIERSSPYVGVIENLKTIFDNEWNTMSKTDRLAIQTALEDKGFSVGPTGLDARMRYGEVAYTEHAIADFLVEAAKQGARNLKTGEVFKLEDLKKTDFNPEKIKELVESIDVTSAVTAPVISPVSGPAVQLPTPGS